MNQPLREAMVGKLQIHAFSLGLTSHLCAFEAHGKMEDLLLF
jgi:hypothetical protein